MKKQQPVGSDAARATLARFESPLGPNSWLYLEGLTGASEGKLYFELAKDKDQDGDGSLYGRIYRVEPHTRKVRHVDGFRINPSGNIAHAPFGMYECLTRHADRATRLEGVLWDIFERATRRADELGPSSLLKNVSEGDKLRHEGSHGEAIRATNDIDVCIARAMRRGLFDHALKEGEA